MSVGKYLPKVRSFLELEGENIRRFDLPWRRRLWLYSNGFLSSRDPIWTLTKDSKANYLSDIKGVDSKIRQVDSPYDFCLDNKILFHLIVSLTHGELLPDVYGITRDGRIDSIGYMNTLQSFDQLIDLLREEPVVAKPPSTARGDGVRILDGRGDRFRINDQEVSKDELYDDLRGGRALLLQEYVSQASYAADIFPGAANTIRVITMVDPETTEPFVAAAMHRFGTSESGTVDNASSGGISAGIDIETGELGRVLTPREGTNSRWIWMEKHPDTGTRIAGTVIPKWDQVKSGLLDLAADYGNMWPLAGWDVVIPENGGTITVIEGNANVGTTFIQAHHPLLEDDRVRRFFEYHNVL